MEHEIKDILSNKGKLHPIESMSNWKNHEKTGLASVMYEKPDWHHAFTLLSEELEDLIRTDFNVGFDVFKIDPAVKPKNNGYKVEGIVGDKHVDFKEAITLALEKALWSAKAKTTSSPAILGIAEGENGNLCEFKAYIN